MNKKPLKLSKKLKLDNTFWDYQKFPIWKKEPKFVITTIISLSLLIISWGIIIYFYQQFPPQIPLFYTKLGEELLAPRISLYFLPLGFALFTLVNFYMAHLYYRKDIVLTQLLIYVNLFLNIMLIVIIFKLLYLVGLIF